MDLKLQVLRQEVKQYRKISVRVTERLFALIELTKFRHKYGQVGESDYERLADRQEISARTLYRWAAAYERGGVRALEPKKAPGRKPTPIRGHVARWVRYYRLRYRWGAEVIQAHLARDHGIELGVDRLKRYLRRPELRLRKRIKQARKKAHTRVVQVEHPGAHTQTDVKHLPHLLPNGQKCYVYNFVDHASRWSFKRAYDSYGPSETRDFMSAVIQAAPFTIRRSQTDNGVEFTNKYVSHIDEPDNARPGRSVRVPRHSARADSPGGKRAAGPGRALAQARRRRAVSPDRACVACRVQSHTLRPLRVAQCPQAPQGPGLENSR